MAEVESRRRVRLQHTQRYRAPVERVFPLLCPVREHDYIPRWEAEILHLASGYAEKGGVFTTASDGGGRDVWVISRYEPNARIQFVRVDGQRTMVYDLFVEPEGSNSTRIRWEQEITALRPEADSLVATHTQADFSNMLRGMADLLEQYLAEPLEEPRS